MRAVFPLYHNHANKIKNKKIKYIENDDDDDNGTQNDDNDAINKISSYAL